jgi:D-glycero-alpha-D-manno-heptose-7-phosphate kinase
MKIKKVKAPVRIDFAGGTTDIEPFASKDNGCVLNCAINRYIVGKLITSDKKTHLEYTGNIPTSSGLGTSGAMNLVWLALISKIHNKEELAEKVYKLEQSQGLVGGKQDQYAAALGGINFLEFGKGKTKITQLKLKKEFIKKLENRLVLFYTGEHYSGSANRLMIENLKKGKNKMNLIRIRNIARKMKNSLLKEDLDSFADLMNQETEERKKLHKSIIPKQMENYMNKGKKNGAVAAKVCGAGNGGSILFFGDKKRLKKTFKKGIIDFKIDFNGLKLS